MEDVIAGFWSEHVSGTGGVPGWQVALMLPLVVLWLVWRWWKMGE